ncbi:uncharacterized protein EDB93DRAFT_1105296 [Suillus bovinus]|uniref:uncharacterized protein n=1 Tax=Suillus bovinus TaxID=48563 RepID=UPI001B8615D0|nr:uncharacterized protein EDB93DRAFT_1105296 [Suillus bovinus]KAG2143456.1 hypothetical protein EDB93DRAFT_1105296 [Suillus bovinus]
MHMSEPLCIGSGALDLWIFCVISCWISPRWVSDDDEFQALLVPPPDLQHLQPVSMDKIPGSHVIHGLQGTTMTTEVTMIMGTMTTVAPVELPEDSSTRMINPETHKQTFVLSKELIISIFFTPDTLASLSAYKKCIIKKFICEVRLKIPALLTATQWNTNNKDIGKIWYVVTKFCTAFMTIICQAIMMGYSLFPPPGCDILPDTFRVDQDGALVIHIKFNKSPHWQLHYAIGAAGTITELVLIEQGMVQLTKGRITPQIMSLTFNNILLALDVLSDDEKAVVDEFKDSMVVCGHSQQHINDDLSDFDFQ